MQFQKIQYLKYYTKGVDKYFLNVNHFALITKNILVCRQFRKGTDDHIFYTNIRHIRD